MAALFIAGFIAGCSDGKPAYDYAIPKKICNVSVATSDVKPLLPPGKSVKEDPSESLTRPGESKSCGVIVDERPDLSVSISRQGGELDIAEKAADKYIDLKRVSLGGGVTSAAVGDDGAVAWMKCTPKPGQRQYEFPKTKEGKYGHLALEVHAGDGIRKPDNIEEWRAHILQFLRAYVPELVKVWCV
ncbi:hypothetical protein ACFXOS_15180 [Streptomyces sp. NPDC059175]|uniref:hypothetical protein n=1 Tax=Streptomyces sp. NPDC059175 TaxID=3346757 RepID=UPI0036814D80